MDRIIPFIKTVMDRFNQAEVLGFAAQLAYFFLLSLFPFLLFAVTLLGYLPLDDQLLIDMLVEYLPEQVGSMIQENLTQIMNNRSGGLLSISVLGTLWSASNGFNAITKSVNRAYKINVSRNFLVDRFIAIGLMLSMMVAIVFALLLPVFGNLIGELLVSFIALPENFLSKWNLFRWITSSIIFFILFYTLYKIAPHVKIRENYVIWGALFATIAWQITSYGFSFYVETLGNFSITYGSLGTVIILMIWFYLSGIIIITGGVINAVLTEHKEKEQPIDDSSLPKEEEKKS